MSHEPDRGLDHSGAIDYIRQCPTCGEWRHKSAFRVGRRGCAACEAVEELNRAERLRTSHVLWVPGGGPKPLVSDWEREGVPAPPGQEITVDGVPIQDVLKPKPDA